MELRSATLRDEQEAIEEQEAQMKAQRQKLRSRNKPAPAPGTVDAAAQDSAGKNAGLRGQGITVPKIVGNKTRARSTAKNKNWGPASSQRKAQKRSPLPQRQTSPPPPARVGGRRPHLQESGIETNTHREQAAEEPGVRHVQNSSEERPQVRSHS